jgi:hypothetical protein
MKARLSRYAQNLKANRGVFDLLGPILTKLDGK